MGVELSDNDDYSYKFDFSPINSSRTRLLHEEIFNKKKFFSKISAYYIFSSDHLKNSRFLTRVY